MLLWKEAWYVIGLVAVFLTAMRRIDRLNCQSSILKPKASTCGLDEMTERF